MALTKHNLFEQNRITHFLSHAYMYCLNLIFCSKLYITIFETLKESDDFIFLAIIFRLVKKEFWYAYLLQYKNAITIL